MAFASFAPSGIAWRSVLHGCILATFLPPWIASGLCPAAIAGSNYDATSPALYDRPRGQLSQTAEAPPQTTPISEPFDLSSDETPWNAPPAAAQPHCINDANSSSASGDAWHSQVLPQGIIYQSYMAGAKEPRFATFFNQNNATGNMWDVTLGARAGIWRYGNDDPDWPEGWQVDLEGGVFPRLDPDGPSTPLYASDFRFGIPVTYGGDRWEFKVAYYHISAHLGDEYLLTINPAADRINYVRDGLALGAGYFVTPALRLYGELGYAAVDGGAKPLEFQFGFDWAQAHNTGLRGGPFMAVNTNLRQEVDFGGDIVVQFGWMWRKYARGSNVRIGGEYFYGKSDQFEFFHVTESRLGWGIWYDF